MYIDIREAMFQKMKGWYDCEVLFRVYGPYVLDFERLNERK